MDISSKKWRVHSGDGVLGYYRITNKVNGQSRYIPASDMPTQHTLSMAKEADFDRMIARIYD